MQNIETVSLTLEQVKRLAWRCRRGLLELDIVLQCFSERHLATLSAAELAAFDALLDLPDNEFLDIVTQRKILSEDPSVAMQTLMQKLNPNLATQH